MTTYQTQLFSIKMVDDYFSDIIQFLSTRMDPSRDESGIEETISSKRKRLSVDCREFIQVGSR
jgi:hypothetical protein